MKNYHSLLNRIYNKPLLFKSARYFFKEITPKLYTPSLKPRCPEQLHLSTTNICTADCIFCAYGRQNMAKGMMSDELFKLVLEQYAEMGGSMVSLTPLVGEALVDPKIFDRISFAYNMKVFRHIAVVTNGNLLMKNDNYKKIVDCGLNTISFSIPEFNEEGYRLMFRNNFYKQTLEGIHKLLEYHKKTKSDVKIIIAYKARKPLSEILNDTDYIQWIAPFVDGKLVNYEYRNEFDSWGGLITEKEMIGEMRLGHFTIRNSPCWQTYSATVLWNGDVRVCPCRFNPALDDDELHVGNIKEFPLKDIFQGNKSANIRKSFLMGTPPKLCTNCKLYSRKPLFSQWILLAYK